jgi:hypothetical protein
MERFVPDSSSKTRLSCHIPNVNNNQTSLAVDGKIQMTMIPSLTVTSSSVKENVTSVQKQ